MELLQQRQGERERVGSDRTAVVAGGGLAGVAAAVVLPPRPSPVVTRELVYTAVTRVRERLTLFASEDVLVHAIGARTTRASGLTDGLLSLD